MKKQIKILMCVVFVSIFSGSFLASARETTREEKGGRLKQWIEKRKEKAKKNRKAYGSGDMQFILQHDGLTRKYKVHVPPSYNQDDPTPIVVYIHGGKGDLTAAYRDGIDKFSDKYGFILAVPEGTGEVKLGHFRGMWNGGKWETGECCGNADDVGFISKMIEEIKNNFNIDEKRVYATGISNGGSMSNRLGCELSEKIAAIATVAPAAIISNCRPLGTVSVMTIHGTADPINPLDGSEPKGIFNEKSGSGFAVSYKRMSSDEIVNVWKKENGCSDKFITGYKKGNANCIVYNECRSGAEVELCIVEGMGHTYPSGSQYLPAFLIGAVSYDISFDQIWEFFKKHPKK